MEKNFLFKLKVYYEDTDSGGVVYYANYLKFLERARSEFIYSIGLSNKKLLNEFDTLIIVKSCNIEYKKSAKLEDELEIFSSIKSYTKTSFIMEQIVKRRDEIICSGWIYFGNKWKIEEIDKNIALKNQHLLYDFLTEKKFRNMGYYKLLLKIIQNKFRKKRLMIYSLSHNNKSIRAIEKVGFKLVRKLKKY